MEAVCGVRELGFTITVLPAATAATVGSSARWKGTFQGPKIRQTPRASYTIEGSVPESPAEGSTRTGSAQVSSSARVWSIAPHRYPTSRGTPSVGG